MGSTLRRSDLVEIKMMVSEGIKEGMALMAKQYHPATWERVSVVGASLAFVGLVGWLAIRNEPFRDQNLVVLLRLVLSLSVAVLGAAIPGFLHVNVSGKGLVIRAGGALALFVITFFFTPKVLPLG